MSADFGVPWRSSANSAAAAAAACSSNSNSESRSPSLSSLPPLPDLIPIRKSNSNNANNNNNNTLIKANLKHAPSQNNGQPVCATNNLNMNHYNQNSSSSTPPPPALASSNYGDQNGNIANESHTTTTTSIDIKPNATELSLYQCRDAGDDDGNRKNGTEQHNGGDDANVSLLSSIKQERRPSDGGEDDGSGDTDTHNSSAIANSADAIMANVCVSIDASYFTNRNENTVQCDNNSNVDGSDQLNKSTTSSSTLSSGTLIKSEVCQSNSLSSQSDNTSSVVHENAIHNTHNNINDKSEKDSTLADNNTQQQQQQQQQQTTIKAGNSKKNQNNIVTDIPKRTTRSALDTYECKPKLYTPLPPHYYSVQYARAARKPKRKVLKGKGRGGVSKVGRKPKANNSNSTNATTKNASLALKNMVGPKSKTTSSSSSTSAAAATAAAETQSTPKQSRISPLFVFATCENARITNVRCEEYDKRNRIVITKTANGWRSIPRTDGSTPNVTDLSAALLPNIMLSRIDDPNANVNGKSTVESQKRQRSTSKEKSTKTATATTTATSTKANPTWRVNPFSSQNRIFIKKDVLNNNNDSEFNSMYEMNRHHHMSDCNSSNAENSSGLDTSASDKVHLTNDEPSHATHKKHKKHKKKKKHKHKSKMDKMALSTSGGESSFVSHSLDVSLKRTASQSAHDDGDDVFDYDNEIAHATLIPKSTTVTNASGNANASECKFTIRLSKNGESSFVPAKKPFLTATATATATTQSHQSHRSPKSEFIATKKSGSGGTGLKLKIISERRERNNTENEHEQERANNNSNKITEMHSETIENTPVNNNNNNDDDDDGDVNMCDSIETKTKAANLDALSASVNHLAAATAAAAATTTHATKNTTNIIDYEKMVVDTKKEIVTPAVSPYNQVAYPPSPPLPPRQSQPLLTMLAHTFKQEQQQQQPLMRAALQGALHPPMATTTKTTPNATSISSCKNVDSKLLAASPDSVPVELYDSKLSVKQCVVSTNSAPTQFIQCSDNNNRNCFGNIGNDVDVDDDDDDDGGDDVDDNQINLNHKKQLQECIELLDESSCEIDNNIEIVNNKTHDLNSICHRTNPSDSLSHLRHAFSKYPDLIAPIGSDEDDDVDLFNAMSGNDLIVKDINDSGSGNSDDGNGSSNSSSRQHAKIPKIKDTMCMGVDYNEIDSNLLLSAQPVADILSQLDNDALAPSTPSKCLSFNDASNMDGLSDSLMQFNQNSFDELISQGFEKHQQQQQQQRAEKEEEMQRHEQQKHKQKQQKQTNQNTSGKDVVCTTIVSPDSCEDELPKDLSFKKQTKEIATGLRIASPRTISRGSDAIQSPQPSGLPAVPPSPDIMMAALHHQHHLQQQHNNNNSNSSGSNKKQNPLFLDISSPSPKSTESSHHLSTKADFFDLTSPLLKDENENSNVTITPPNNNSNSSNSSNSPNSILKRTLQREPLDLGGQSRHRKSASPTISCSQDGEPVARRMKIDHHHHHATKDTNASQSTSINDPDPLTQLRLLMNNPEWKIPDPILVPKNRLNAVLASPAREIPLLLTTRPDLRLPEAFAFPSILQDPDILVISFAQLETIIRKQNEFMKDADRNVVHNKHTAQAQTKQKQTPPPPPLAPPPPPLTREHHKERSVKQQMEKLSNATAAANHDKNQVKSTGGGNGGNLANDINAATLEALNQMFWLPYLTQLLQMGQISPDILKAMSPPNLAAMLQQQQNPLMPGAQPFGLTNGLPNLGNPLELAMWQEANANKVALQRIMEMNAQNMRETAPNKSVDDAKVQHERLAAALRQQNLLQQQQQQQQHQQQQAAQMQKSATAFFQNFQSNRLQSAAQSKNSPQSPAFLSPTFGKESQNESQSRKSCNLQSPPLSKSLMSNQLAQNPFFAAAAAANNFPNMAAMAKLGLMGAANSTESNNGSTTNALRKTRKEQVLQQQQQQQQQHLQALLLAQQQLQQQHSQVNLASMHHPSSDSASNKALMNLLQQQSNLDPHRSTARNDSTNKMSSIPSFDLTSSNANASHSASSSTSSSSNRPHIRVKNGQHLLDPLAAQRRLLAANARCNELPEIGSTTNGIDQMLGNAGLLSPQASNYASQWPWTKVTATGE